MNAFWNCECQPPEGCPLEGGGFLTTVGTRDHPPSLSSTWEPETLKPLKIDFRAFLTIRKSLGVGFRVFWRRSPSVAFPRSGTSVSNM